MIHQKIILHYVIGKFENNSFELKHFKNFNRLYFNLEFLPELNTLVVISKNLQRIYKLNILTEKITYFLNYSV